MKDTIEGCGWLVMVVLLIFLGFGAWAWTRSKHDNQITAWATEHHYTVKSIERVGSFSNDSPFWRKKDDDLCRAILLDHDHLPRTAFFR